jgi:integrase
MGAMAQQKVRLTAETIAAHECPADRSQAFLWDAKVPGLAVRATPSGAKAFVFQGLYRSKDVRCTLGSVHTLSIEQARARAKRLQVEIDEGRDPREMKRTEVQAQQLREEQRATAAIEAQRQALTVADAWDTYIEAQRPEWGERHYLDHLSMARAGGQAAQRGTRARGTTIAGPIHALLGMPLASLDADVLRDWATQQAKTRPTVGRLAFRHLRAFLRWCAADQRYKTVLRMNPADDLAKARKALGAPVAKRDVLLSEQLPAWFAAVQAVPNPRIAAYLQVLLLTGARPSEALNLRWADINVKWRSITIGDKVEGHREIPLTPYVRRLIEGLPRTNDSVFASATAQGGVMTLPHHQHERACKVAGIEGLTLHGLRRSFGTLSEWLEVPTGVVAQIQGHKPSALAEKHYRVRPLDMLRVHHERIEAWILQKAGIDHIPGATAQGLQVVPVAA